MLIRAALKRSVNHIQFGCLVIFSLRRKVGSCRYADVKRELFLGHLFVCKACCSYLQFRSLDREGPAVNTSY